MFRIADDFQLDKRAECSAEGSDVGEKLRKRSSRTAHTVHDRPGKNFDRSGQSEFQKGNRGGKKRWEGREEQSPCREKNRETLVRKNERDPPSGMFRT